MPSHWVNWNSIGTLLQTLWAVEITTKAAQDRRVGVSELLKRCNFIHETKHVFTGKHISDALLLYRRNKSCGRVVLIKWF